MLSDPPKFAVIGTGAAGLSVLTALLRQPSDARITVFDIGKPVVEMPSNPEASDEWATEFYSGIYQKIRSLHPFKFPPPKTHFGHLLPKYRVDNKHELFRSESFGGLTNYWGATMIPFTEREVAKWPIKIEALTPYYRELAKLIGISGRQDALNQYFPEEFSTLPPLRLTKILSRLNQVVNATVTKGNYEVISGICRCGLETREGYANTCIYCGECLAGCFLGSIYSSKHTIQKYLQDSRVTEYAKGKVLAVDPAKRSIGLKTEVGEEVLEGFDKIFLCAGCIGSTEIVLRSTGVKQACDMADNAVYVFPILYLGKVEEKARNEPYLSLCNLIFGCIPRSPKQNYAETLIYPNFDYMWRYNLPPKLWPLFKPVSDHLRSRLFWGRLYVHGDESQAYRVAMEDDKIVFDVARMASGVNVPELMSSIQSAVNREGFSIPPIPPILQKTNSHYAATLPYGGDLIDVPPNGEIMPNTYLCDSACFPELPAVSLTFTIMANAYRTAMEAIND